MTVMPVGWQEILALAIVALVVAIALYRRLKRSRERQAACCDTPSQAPKSEHTVHFYRRRDD